MKKTLVLFFSILIPLLFSSCLSQRLNKATLILNQYATKRSITLFNVGEIKVRFSVRQYGRNEDDYVLELEPGQTMEIEVYTKSAYDFTTIPYDKSIKKSQSRVYANWTEKQTFLWLVYPYYGGKKIVVRDYNLPDDFNDKLAIYYISGAAIMTSFF